MTCFWDGLLRNLDQEDLNLLNSNKNINNRDFILLLKKNNKICENVKWQDENLIEQLLKENYSEDEFYKDKRIQVSIFMSPLNVHNQLYPISGNVKYTKYHPGKFLVAWHPKASTDNERSTVVLENDSISVLCRQIAGAVARRIITYPKVEDKVDVADELGFIKFGSRVDLFFPLGTKINVALEQKVTGGQSIITTY